jgi:hypothetical protein
LPSSSNNIGADLWAYLILIDINNGIKSRSVNQPFFAKDSLKCLYLKLRVRRQKAMGVVIIMVMWHEKILPQPRGIGKARFNAC